MKKTFCIIFLCISFLAQIPTAYAQAAEMSAAYTEQTVEDEAGLSAAFIQSAGLELVQTDAGETRLPAVWLFYDDGSYEQYAAADDGKNVLFCTGDFIINGSFEDKDAVLTIHRTQKYTDETGLTAEQSTDYVRIGDPGLARVFPPEEKTNISVSVQANEAPHYSDYSTEGYFDEGVNTNIQITGYTEHGGNPASCFLAPGDKVAVISPSALPGWEQTRMTAEGLKSWGFEPMFGKHSYGEVRTLEECIEDLRWALEDPEIKAIFCVRGGYGATEVMDAVSEELIKSAGKAIIGFSDITACHMAWSAAGVPSIHACMSTAFLEFPEDCAQAELHMLMGELPSYECQADDYCKAGTAEGILIGGNLSTFAAALDTAYDCTKLNQPYILFLEETGENMQHIHRYLTILKHKGILDNAAGIVFGEWTGLPADGLGNYGATRGGPFASTAEMISRQFLDGMDIPVAFGFPAGHGKINYPLLMGAAAKIEVSEDSYTLSWPAAAGK